MSKRKANSQNNTKQTNKPTGPSWFLNTRLHILIVFIFSALLYVNTLGHDYALDDAIVIYDNEFTTQGVSGIDELFKYDTFRGFFKTEGKANLVEGGRYRPFTPAMFALEISLFGKSPFIGHLGNILLYGSLCALLYLVLLRLFKEKFNEEKAIFIALVTSLIFAAHPVHTEVIANIKGRDEIMTLLGSLGALYFSLRAWKEKKNRWIIAAALSFFIGLLSKENAITFIGVVPLAFWIFTKASIKEILVQIAPYFLVAAVFLTLRANAIAPPEGLSKAEIEQIRNRPKDLMNDPFQKVENNKYVPLSTAEKSATITHTLGVYLKLLFVPAPLTHDYYPRHIDVKTWSEFSVLLSFLLYLSMGILGIFYTLKRNVWGFVLLFYLGTFSIVSNIFFPIGTNMAERFLFIPSISFALAIALALHYYSNKKTVKGFDKYNIAFAGIGVYLFVFSGMTFARNPVWKDNFTLFTTDVKVSNKSAKLLNAAGGELVTKSVEPKFSNKKTSMQQEAVTYLNEAIRIHPNYKNAYLLRGNALNYLQQYEQSIDSYKAALNIDPNYEEANNNLAITYRDAGRYYGEQKQDVSKAIQYLTEAYKMTPNDFQVVRLLGVAYGQTTDKQKSLQFFTKATQIEPNNAGAWYDLGTAYHFLGNEEKRIEYHNKALTINPNYLNERQN